MSRTHKLKYTTMNKKEKHVIKYKTMYKSNIITKDCNYNQIITMEKNVT